MSEASRAAATAARERFWAVYDRVPDDMLTDGCEWCESGWATGPGLIYRCDNCNALNPLDLTPDGKPLPTTIYDDGRTE